MSAHQRSSRRYAPTPPASAPDQNGGRVDYLGVVIAYDLPPAYPENPGSGVHIFKWIPRGDDSDYFVREMWNLCGDKLERVTLASGNRGMYICEFYCTFAEARDLTLRAAAKAWSYGSMCAESCERQGLENCPGVMRKRRIQERRAQRLAAS